MVMRSWCVIYWSESLQGPTFKWHYSAFPSAPQILSKCISALYVHDGPTAQALKATPQNTVRNKDVFILTRMLRTLLRVKEPKVTLSTTHIASSDSFIRKWLVWPPQVGGWRPQVLIQMFSLWLSFNDRAHIYWFLSFSSCLSVKWREYTRSVQKHSLLKIVHTRSGIKENCFLQNDSIRVWVFCI